MLLRNFKNKRKNKPTYGGVCTPPMSDMEGWSRHMLNTFLDKFEVVCAASCLPIRFLIGGRTLEVGET